MTEGSATRWRTRPPDGDALSWLLWQPYDLQRPVSDVSTMGEQRTFASTEAQTDDPPPLQEDNRRRRLPDLLDSHLPPPYHQPLPLHVLHPARRRWASLRCRVFSGVQCFLFLWRRFVVTTITEIGG